jgi:hypothetical protein
MFSSLFVRRAHRTTPGPTPRPGRISALPMPARLRAGHAVPPGTSATPGRWRRASPRRRDRRRRSATWPRGRGRRRDERAQHGADVDLGPAGRKPARAAATRRGRPDLRLGHLEVHAEEPREERRAPLRVREHPGPGRVCLERRASIALASLPAPAPVERSAPGDDNAQTDRPAGASRDCPQPWPAGRVGDCPSRASRDVSVRDASRRGGLRRP